MAIHASAMFVCQRCSQQRQLSTYQKVIPKHYLQQALRMQLSSTKSPVCIHSHICTRRQQTFILQIQAVLSTKKPYSWNCHGDSLGMFMFRAICMFRLDFVQQFCDCEKASNCNSEIFTLYACPTLTRFTNFHCPTECYQGSH